MKEDFTITVDKSCTEARRLILEGRITSTTANTLHFQVEENIRMGYAHLILNMRQVTFLSSAGIRVLLMFYKEAKKQGGSFHVESPSENVENVLGMTALDAMLLKPGDFLPKATP